MTDFVLAFGEILMRLLQIHIMRAYEVQVLFTCVQLQLMSSGAVGFVISQWSDILQAVWLIDQTGG